MKVLYVLRSVAHFSYHDRVMARLCAAGHCVQVLFDEELSKNRPGESVQEGLTRMPGFEVGWSLRRRGLWRPIAFPARELASYASYLVRPGQSAYYRERWRSYLPAPLRLLTKFPPVRTFLASERARQALRALEDRVPPDRAILQRLREDSPSVLVASSVNLRFAEEVEYVKAARTLGIPVVYAVLSWDNLTTKGLYRIPPDLLLAWNRVHLEEAVAIHGVPEERIVITGSPFFDKWFEERPGVLSREAFGVRVGLDPAKPYVVWLGSSKNIAMDETWLVLQLAEALRASPSPAVRELGILARPHPANAKVFEKLTLDRGICVWPRRPFAYEKGVPSSPEALEDLQASLRYSIATVGINTTGMIDAAISDRPCLALLTPDYASTQEQAVHFQHLLKARVLETVADAAGCAVRLGAILAGEDARREERRRFVREFVRPHGLGVAASDLAARAIQRAADRVPPALIRQEIEGAG